MICNYKLGGDEMRNRRSSFGCRSLLGGQLVKTGNIRGIKTLGNEEIRYLTQDEIGELIEPVNNILVQIRQELEELERELQGVNTGLLRSFPANQRLQDRSMDLMLKRSMLVGEQSSLHGFQQALRSRWRQLDGLDKAS